MTGLAGPLVLVGCGKMGGALLARLAAPRPRARPTPSWSSRTPGSASASRAQHGVRALAEAEALPTDLQPRALVFAVKPQAMAGVLPAYRAPGGARRAWSCRSPPAPRSPGSRRRSARRTPIVRAMPNTPAAIGQGVTALCANAHVSAAQRQLCSALMAAVGAVHWIDDEEQMHAITAMSGGGPAYVFLLIETLAKAGDRPAACRRISPGRWRAPRSPAAARSPRSSEEPVEVLRQNVTSPGGTTQAALAVLMAADGIQPLFDRAIAAGAQRSRELA